MDCLTPPARNKKVFPGPSLFICWCSSRRQTLVWKPSWQRWSWLLCRGRSRRAPQTTRSLALYGRSTSLTPSSQTVSYNIEYEMLPIKKLTFLQVLHTFLHFLAGSHNTPSLWAGTNGGCVFAYMLRLPPVEHRADEPITAQQGEN